MRNDPRISITIQSRKISYKGKKSRSLSSTIRIAKPLGHFRVLLIGNKKNKIEIDIIETKPRSIFNTIIDTQQRNAIQLKRRHKKSR
ncbi:hypothetical protein CR513_58097, partial [Mucuna pruriens]